MLAPTYSGLPLFNSPASHNTLTCEWKEERVVQMEGRMCGRVGELDTRAARELERLPRAPMQHLTAEGKWWRDGVKKDESRRTQAEELSLQKANRRFGAQRGEIEGVSEGGSWGRTNGEISESLLRMELQPQSRGERHFSAMIEHLKADLFGGNWEA